MTPSAQFERTTARVLDVLDRVPSGRVTTYGAIGEAIGVVPRYVALIMARAPEVATAPWHRVVGADGRIKSGGHAPEQRRRLAGEGCNIAGNVITDFRERYVRP